MNILICGGEKTINIVKAIHQRFQNKGVKFIVENNIVNVGNIVSRGDYFDRAIVIEQGWTDDGKETDEYIIRRKIAEFVKVVRENHAKDCTCVFLAATNEKAKIVSEEIIEISNTCAVIVKDAPYSLAFFRDLVITGINVFSEELVYKLESSDVKEVTVYSAKETITKGVLNTVTEGNISDSELEEVWEKDSVNGTDNTEEDSDLEEGNKSEIDFDEEIELEESESESGEFREENKAIEDSLKRKFEEMQELEVYDEFDNGSDSFEDFEYGDYEENGEDDLSVFDELDYTDLVGKGQESSDGDFIDEAGKIEDNEFDEVIDEFNELDEILDGTDDFIDESFEEEDKGTDGRDLRTDLTKDITNAKQEEEKIRQQSLAVIDDIFNTVEESDELENDEEEDEHDEEETKKVEWDKQETNVPYNEDQQDSRNEEAGAGLFKSNIIKRFDKNNNKKSTKERNIPVEERRQDNDQGYGKRLKEVLQSVIYRGNSIVVTGAEYSGVSTIVNNMANVLCKLGMNVVIVDMDTKYRSQAYITKKAYSAVHSVSTENLSLKLAINNSSMSISKNVNIISPGLHLFGNGLGCDSMYGDELANREKLIKFDLSLKNNYNFVIYDMPFPIAVDYAADICMNSDNILVACDYTNRGITSYMLNMCNIDSEHMQANMFNRASLCFNKYRKLNTIFGNKIKNINQIMKMIDNKVLELLGIEPDFYFKDIRICSALDYDERYEEGWYGSAVYSDKNRGFDVYSKLLMELLDVR